MKNRFILTLSDINGSKSYNLHNIVKKFLWFFALLFMVIIAGGYFTIDFLNEKYSKLKEKKQQQIALLMKDEQKLKVQNEFYSEQIKRKAQDIEQLGSKLEDIEKIIGLKVQDQETLLKRASIAKLTSFQRKFMLQILPSGYPVKIGKRVTSHFGYRTHPVSKKRSFHYGIDLGTNDRTRVYATADGVVDYVQSKNIGSFGRLVRISHNYGFQTIYAHLARTDVKTGDVVTKGDQLGLSGRSGRVTGPHLHYEVKYGIKNLNPKPFLTWTLQNYEKIFEKQRRVKWDKIIELMESHKLAIAQQ